MEKGFGSASLSPIFKSTTTKINRTTMNTIRIIPLKDIEKIKDIQLEDVYIIPTKTISQLIIQDDYPISKDKAIKKILDFLMWFEIKLKIHKTNKLTIHWTKLDKFFSYNTRTFYIKLLSHLNIIKKKGTNGEYYKQGVKSTTYQFTNEYINDELCLVLLNSKKDFELECNIKVLKKYKDTISNIEVDYYNAIKDEIDYCGCDINRLRSRISILLSTNNRRFISEGSNNTRIYHSFSNVSRVSRKHLSINNKKFKSIDIKNSQPLISCYLIKKDGLELDDNYLSDCENGKIYERFVGIFGNFTTYCNGYSVKEYKELTRDDVKEELYRSVYFYEDKNNLVNIKFREIYPNTYKSLMTYEKTALTLQKIEAKIFNNLRPKSKYYFTLFDAVYFTDSIDIEYLYNEITSIFKDMDIKVSLSID